MTDNGDFKSQENAHNEEFVGITIKNDKSAQRQLARGTSNRVNMAELFESDPRDLDKIKDMMKNFDDIGDGKLGVEEILKMHNELMKEKRTSTHLKELILVLFVVLCMSIAANFGTSVVANQVTSETALSGTFLVNSASKTQIIHTTTASTDLPLYLLPFGGPDLLNRINHIQFTALGVTFDSPQIQGTYPALQIGMDIESFQYYDETSVLLQGVGTERLLIDAGSLRGWGFDGITGSFPVCPGMSDSSHGKCYMLATNDVDVAALRAKAYMSGVGPS